MFPAIPSSVRGISIPCRPRVGFLLVILSLALFRPIPSARAEDSSQRGTHELLRLIPHDSGVVLTLDDLRGQVRGLLASRLAGELQKVPAVRAWFDSEKYQQLETARDQIEGMLHAKLTEIRDQVLGDAVVFALRLPSDGPADPARAQGIVLLKAHDPALLKRLIDLFNTIQRNNGEITAVVERKRGEIPYSVRQFPAGSNHAPDAYVAFADGTFAISNSEDLVGAVIDRKTATVQSASRSPAALDAIEKFRLLGQKLPDRTLARLVIDAHLVERLIKNSPHPRSSGEALIERYVGALESVGAALVIQDDRMTLQTAEVFDPRTIPEILSRSTAASSRAPAIDRVPDTTLAIASVQVDFAALYKLLLPMVPELEQWRLANAESVLQGILLGQNLETRIMPGVGPRVLAFLDVPVDWEPKSEAGVSPNRGWPFPSIIAVELATDLEAKPAPGGPSSCTSVADAIDNALNTILAMMSLDEKRAQAHPRIVTRVVAGVLVKSLDPPFPFAYAVDRPGHRLVIGNSVAVVEGYLAAGSDPRAGSRFRRLQATAFADASSFFCLDLAAVQTAIERHRSRLIEMIASNEHRERQDVTRDLDQMLNLAKLFDAAYLTSRIDFASSTVFHILGVLVRPVEQTALPPKP
jgi:hypothetical protein